MNRQTVYRLEALVELAHAYPQAIRVAELAARRHIPRPFLARLLTELAHAGVVVTSRGPAGGVALARPPAEIGVLQVLPTDSEVELGGAAVRWLTGQLAEAKRAVLAPLSLANLAEEERRASGATHFEI